jgi:hypothetical protein
MIWTAAELSNGFGLRRNKQEPGFGLETAFPADSKAVFLVLQWTYSKFPVLFLGLLALAQGKKYFLGACRRE